jgi:hypothetical protein
VSEFVDKNLVRVVFIDAPVHPETVFYVGYFLAALNAKKDFWQAVAARRALFEAARPDIQGKEALETFLKTKKIDILPYDTAPDFKIFEKYLREDRINSTPTCVIIDPKGKQTLIGKGKIAKGLRDLRKYEN